METKEQIVLKAIQDLIMHRKRDGMIQQIH